MKKLRLLGFLFLSVAITSCSKDDDKNNDSVSSNSYLEIGTETYLLKAGGLEYYGTWGEGSAHNFDVTLFSTDVTTSNGEQVPVDDVYTTVYFELWTGNASDIEVGSYTYNSTGAGFTFTYGDITNSQDEGNYESISAGTLEVLQAGNVYEFSFEGTTFSGKNVALYYKGSLYENDSSVERIATMPKEKFLK